MTSPASRFEEVSRRTFSRRSFVAGAAVLVPVLAACGKSDEDAFSSTSDGAEATTGSPNASQETTAAALDTTPAVVDTTAAVVDTTAVAVAETPTGTPLSEGAQLTVDFTFAAEDTGRRVNNPYIAVWIENEAEDLVQTVSLWYNPPKGRKWLPDLKRWYSVDQTRIDAGGEDVAETISSATRVAGSYSVVWDGTDIDGNKIAAGTYFVCIEAAREHGPYELVRGPVTLGAEPFTTDLTPDGELTAASVTFGV